MVCGGFRFLSFPPPWASSCWEESSRRPSFKPENLAIPRGIRLDYPDRFDSRIAGHHAIPPLCSALWALHNTRTPATFAVIRVTLTAILGYIAVFPLREKFGWEPRYSAACLSASAGMAGWIEFLLIRRALSARIGHFHVGFRPLARYWIAAFVSAAVAYGIEKALPSSHPLLFGILVLGVYGVLYLGITLKFGAPEASEVLSTLRRRLPFLRK